MSSPYQGLRPYGEDDTRYFFGRTDETRRVRANLVASRLTVLFAPSGVGKSSLLLAGVMRSLRETIDRAVRAGRDPDHLPVVVRGWSANPLAAIEVAIEESVERAPRVDAAAIATGSGELTGLAATIDRAARVTHSKVLLMFDQFEELLLYHGAELQTDSDDGPAAELARAMRQPQLRANVLIAIREDALAELDRFFKARVPGLLDNRLRLARLNHEMGAKAVARPLEEWNREHPDDPMELDPALSSAVLTQVSTGAIELGRAGAGGTRSASGTIEAPFLQLVMSRIWEEEREAGSSVLRLETLEALGGSTEIVRTHLDRQMEQLSGDEQDAAAAVFHRLVTPSGAKVALRVSDLADWTGVDQTALDTVLHTLSQGDRRIVRAIPHPTRPDGPPSYEVFHDVLTEPVLDWRTRHETQRQARELVIREKAEARRRWLRRLRLGLLGTGLVVASVIAVLGVIAVQESRKAVSGRLAAISTAQLDVDPERAVLFADAAFRRRPTADAIAALRAAVAADRSLGVLEANSEPLNGVDVAPDRTRLLAFGDEGHVHVWRLPDQRRLADVVTGKAAVRSARFSPDGRRFASSTDDGQVAIWDAATGQRVRTLQGSASRSTAWNASGTRVMAASQEAVLVWDASTGAPVATLRSPRGGIESARWLPGTPDRIATASTDGVVRVWDVRRAAVIQSLDTGAELTDVVTNATGTGLLAIGFFARNVTSWDLRRDRALSIRQPGRSVRGAPLVTAATFDRSGSRVATAGGDGRVWIWDARTGTPVAALTGHGSYVTAIAFSPDGRIVATGSNDRTVRVWDADTGFELSVLRGHGAVITGLAFPTNDRIATAARDGSVQLWRTGARQLASRQLQYPPDTVSLSATGAVLAAANERGGELVRLRGRGTGTRAFVAGGRANTAEVSPDDRYVVIARATEGDPSAAAHVYRIRDSRLVGAPLATSGRRNGAVTAMFSPDGRFILTGHRDGAARLWSARSHRLVRRFGRPARPGFDVTLIDARFSPNGRQVATAGATGVLTIFDSASGRETDSFVASRGNVGAEVNTVTFQPEGGLLAAGGADSSVQVWATETGQARALAHDDSVSSVAFSRDGDVLATGSWDGTARLWDPRTGQALGVVTQRPTGVVSVAVTPDDRILTVDEEGLVQFFECRVCGSATALQREAGAIIDRAFTPEERSDYVEAADG